VIAVGRLNFAISRNYNKMLFQNTLPAIFEQNTYPFSCAESLIMLKEINKFLIDENGSVASFSKFRNKVFNVTNFIDLDELQGEYHLAISCAQMAEKWKGFQIFTALEYRAVGDKSDCKICKALDGLTFSTYDPIWNIIWPPNHLGCSCLVLLGYDENIIKNSDNIINKVSDLILPFFKQNFGIVNIIYNENHPNYSKDF
jgi:SPP1 gp7 family putative phage head morphogenesis protein